MKKLTAEFCEYLLKDLQRKSITGCGIGRTQECYLQALEIALPILEQQEQKENVTLRDGLAALSAHIDSIGGYNFEALEAYRREEFERQERGDGWIEWGGGECPVPASSRVDIKFRDGDIGLEQSPNWDWSHLGYRSDIIAYRIIPEQPTNQNGEQ